MRNLQKKILYLYLYICDRHFRKICQSGVFDPEYYLQSNPDVARQNLDPLLHYYRTGWKEDRSPNPFFKIRVLKQLHESEGAVKEPLSEFLLGGWKINQQHNPYFDTQLYVEKHENVDWSSIDPLSHYVQSGWKEGRSPCPYFDHAFYTQKYPDTEQGTDPFRQYILSGWRERKQPSPAFDPDWYRDRTEALQDYPDDLLVHYSDFGIAEGKSPIPVFDTAWYAALCQREGRAPRDFFADYLHRGENQGAIPCPWFDPAFYARMYMGDGSGSPLIHYVSEGVFRGHYPNSAVQDLQEKPVISILVPVFNAKAHFLRNCIRSVLYQSYPHWQLCLADDCSTEPHVRPLLEEWAAKDSRIRLVSLDSNRGIAGATNAAANIADGEYLGFLDNDDELAPECLFRIAKAINESGADLLYSDEDLIGEDGRRFSVFHKPDYNPELLLCHNYVTHFVVTARKLWSQAGGLDSEKSGAQDHDLFLKLSEGAGRILHLPEVLYHWRASETSTSVNHSQKQYAEEAGRKAVADALLRREIDAEVHHTDLKFYYRVKRTLNILPLVSVIVFSSRDDEECASWLDALLQSTEYVNFEVIVLRSRHEYRDLAAYAAASDRPVKIVTADGGSGLAELLNRSLVHCDGEYVVLLSDACEPENGYWLSALMEYCQRPDTGIVCGHLEIPGQVGLDITPIPEILNQSHAYYARFLREASVLLNGQHCPQNTWCASGFCCAISREALDVCGEFDAERFPTLFALDDFSFICAGKGWQIYYTPHCRLRLIGGGEIWASGESRALTEEQRAFQQKWRQRLLAGDPFYNLGKLEEADISKEEFLKWFAGD